MARKSLLTSVVATNGQRKCCTGNVSCAGEQRRTTKKQEEKNTVKTGVSRETCYIFLSKKISDRVVDDINNVDHRRCEGVVWLELRSIKRNVHHPHLPNTRSRGGIDVLGQGRARHGSLGRCQT